MQISRLAIPDVILVKPRRFEDERGFFSETWSDREFRMQVADVSFVQDNHSLSRQIGTIRGLHFQRPPSGQGKLVRVTRGSVFDVAVDLRRGSPSYGRHVSAVLTAEGGEQLWIPEGFAHAFCTLEADTEFLYKVTSFYSAKDDGGLVWNDPDLAIVWPVAPEEAVLSDKDRQLPRLADLPPIFQMAS
jgi:dTDP-4-dehydrorhamnose 3,5-epimerase